MLLYASSQKRIKDGMLNVSHKLFATPDDLEKENINRVGPSLDKMRTSQQHEVHCTLDVSGAAPCGQHSALLVGHAGRIRARPARRSMQLDCHEDS